MSEKSMKEIFMERSVDALLAGFLILDDLGSNLFHVAGDEDGDTRVAVFARGNPAAQIIDYLSEEFPTEAK